MKLLPGYHPVRAITDAGLTASVDTTANLGWSLLYLALAAAATIFVFYGQTRSSEPAVNMVEAADEE